MARRKRNSSPSSVLTTKSIKRPKHEPTPQLNPITPNEYKSDPTNVFELCTARAGVIKQWFDNLKHILEKTDVNFVLTEEGIDVSHADESKNVVVVSKLFGKEFEFYRCDARISAGIDVGKIHRIVKFVQTNEVLTMQIHRDKPGTLVISMFNEPTDCRTTYTYDLIEEVPDEEIQMPDFAFPRSVSVPSQHFQKKIQDMVSYGVELVEFQSIRNMLILRNYNSPNLPVEVSFKGKARVLSHTVNDEGGSTLVEESGDVDTDMTSEIYQGVFNLKHIGEFVKKGSNEDMTFFIRNDLPLLMQFNISTLGYLRIFIMPVKDT